MFVKNSSFFEETKQMKFLCLWLSGLPDRGKLESELKGNDGEENKDSFMSISSIIT